MELLERVSGHEAGRHLWAQLGRFAKLAFFRVKRDGAKARLEEAEREVEREKGAGGIDGRVRGRGVGGKS